MPREEAGAGATADAAGQKDARAAHESDEERAATQHAVLPVDSRVEESEFEQKARSMANYYGDVWPNPSKNFSEVSQHQEIRDDCVSFIVAFFGEPEHPLHFDNGIVIGAPAQKMHYCHRQRRFGNHKYRS